MDFIAILSGAGTTNAEETNPWKLLCFCC